MKKDKDLNNLILILDDEIFSKSKSKSNMV